MTMPDNRCVSCSSRIEATYRFCPHCGKRQAQGDAWYYHPIWILLLAFVAIGPFALILVWRSRRMQRPVKLVIAALIVIYSVYTGYLLYELTAYEVRLFTDISRAMQLR